MASLCPYCSTENELGAQRCSACGESLSDPLSQALDPEQLARQSASRSKTIRLVAVIGGLWALGGGGFYFFTAQQKEARAKAYRASADEFVRNDKEQLGTFWKCVLGTQMDLSSFKDNLALSGMMNAAFVRAPEDYTKKLTEACAPSAAGGASKVKLIEADGELKAALDKYVVMAGSLVQAAAKTAENL